MDLSHDLVGKVTLFAGVFDRKQCNEKLTMTQTCFTEHKLTGFDFLSRERICH